MSSVLKRQRAETGRMVWHEKTVLVVHKRLPCAPNDCNDCGALREALGASHCPRTRLLNANLKEQGGSLKLLQDEDTVVAVHDGTKEQELLEFLRLSDRKQLQGVTLRRFDWVLDSHSSKQMRNDAKYIWPAAQVELLPVLAVACPQGAGGGAWKDNSGDLEGSSKRVKTGAARGAGGASGGRAMEGEQGPTGTEASAVAGVEDEDQGSGTDFDVLLEEEDFDANGWRRSYGESDRCVSLLRASVCAFCGRGRQQHFWI